MAPNFGFPARTRGRNSRAMRPVPRVPTFRLHHKVRQYASADVSFRPRTICPFRTARDGACRYECGPWEPISTGVGRTGQPSARSIRGRACHSRSSPSPTNVGASASHRAHKRLRAFGGHRSSLRDGAPPNSAMPARSSRTRNRAAAGAADSSRAGVGLDWIQRSGRTRVEVVAQTPEKVHTTVAELGQMFRSEQLENMARGSTYAGDRLRKCH